MRGRQLAEITAFVTRAAETQDDDAYTLWPKLPTAPEQLTGLFERFGLPVELEA